VLIILLLFLGIGSQQVLKLRKQVIQGQDALSAMYFHCDMSSKVMELLESPFTDYSDWKEILPICEQADELFERTHPSIKTFYRLARAVRHQMILHDPR
jgi:hypothetical protein